MEPFEEEACLVEKVTLVEGAVPFVCFCWIVTVFALLAAEVIGTGLANSELPLARMLISWAAAC